MDIEQQTTALANEMKLDSLRQMISTFNESQTHDDGIAVHAIQKAAQLLKQRKKLHKILCAAFAPRFADLAKLISDYEIYARTAKYLCNHNNIDNSELQDILNHQQVVALNLGLTSTLGPEIDSPSFFSACDLQIEASILSRDLSSVAANAVSQFAPNLCALVGAELAAILISFAGGIQQLSTTPACNIKIFGVKKSGLLGMSSRSTNNHQGILYSCDLVQETPPDFRDAVFRDLGNKVALVARIDASKENSMQNGSYGEKFRNEIKTRLDKKMNNHTPKYVRPLPVPGMEKREFRGGRQKRAMKKKFGIGEELTARNKIVFGVGGQFDEDGTQYGATALEGFRKKKAAIDAPFQQKIDKKLKALDKK
ncbi:SnoRNA binding domain containing protein [Tritrichomonas foetus]|uniref:SnoRNA binding domain containing protein n=1 Tax=Tritrichomonas foetus TaxID=1144522 RepID=A0A1J4KQ69_9EUKA|nr:SnoRNA binding domain containing protein [Tritrichomonas foetus]|eukprot:OHT13387.1 SnoRNA binding domain containing protein [Tritrichomonas foetus]